MLKNLEIQNGKVQFPLENLGKRDYVFEVSVNGVCKTVEKTI